MKIMNDESVKKDFPDIEVEDIKVILMDPNEVTLQDFETMIQEINGDTNGSMVYYVANFCRSPMFFSNEGWRERYWKWVMTGHFSPIISYCHNSEGVMYLLVGDVDARYKEWLVRSDRMYEAMKCRELLNGAS